MRVLEVLQGQLQSFPRRRWLIESLSAMSALWKNPRRPPTTTWASLENPVPTTQQVNDLISLIETKTAIVVIETHEEKRVMALFERVSNLSQREVWTWSASRGLRVSQGLKLSLLDFKENISKPWQQAALRIFHPF